MKAEAQIESEVTAATVPLSFVEYRLNFVEPILTQWQNNGAIVQALLRVLRPWNVQLSAVTTKREPANLSEVQISFEVIPQRMVFNLFLGTAALLATNVSWEETPTFRRVAEAIWPALVEALDVEIANQQVSLNMHLTPQGKTIREITRRFAPSDQGDDDGSVRGFGFSVYGSDVTFTVDLSLAYENSLFVRIIRNFDKSLPLDKIESVIRNDQTSLLNRLHLRLN